MSAPPPLIIGCHHKTGTTLLFKLGPIIAERLWRRDQLVVASSAIRKEPLSQVLERLGKDLRCYFNPWFEHEVDLPPSSIRFLHFVRHPVKWVRSAYLYHKRGGPAEGIRWLDWRVFKIGERQFSYCQLLNAVEEQFGVFLEAVRCFPEIAGTARAAYSSAGLSMKRNITLEHFQTDFDASVRSLCEFAGLDPTQIGQIANRLRVYDSTNPDHIPRLNVTHGSDSANRIEHCLSQDPGFRRLYAEPVKQMGFVWSESGASSEVSFLSDAFLDSILDIREQLLTDASSAKGQKFLCSASVRDSWLAFALQSFGEGHLLMHSFIQEMLEGIQVTIPAE